MNQCTTHCCTEHAAPQEESIAGDNLTIHGALCVCNPRARSKVMPSDVTKMICVTSTTQTVLGDQPCFGAEALDHTRLKAEVRTNVHAY
jgi:hypothetical protein